ncbi:MAG: hypothetical protein ACOCV2_08240 [Persicimonas sp.]
MRAQRYLFLVLAASLFGQSACFTPRSGFEEVARGSSDLGVFLEHRPALLVRAEADQVDTIDLSAANFFAFSGNGDDDNKLRASRRARRSDQRDDGKLRSWRLESLGAQLDSFVEQAADQAPLDGRRDVWISATTATSEVFLEQLRWGTPPAPSNWSDGLHVRIMLPVEDDSETVTERLEDVAADEDESELITRVEPLDDHVLVDAFFVDSRLGDEGRDRLWAKLDEADPDAAPSLRPTPALRAFSRSKAPVGVYTRLEAMADFAAVRRAIKLRALVEASYSHDFYSESVDWWLDGFRDAYRERRVLSNRESRAEDLAVEVDPSGDGLAADFVMTRTADAPDRRLADEARRLPEVTDDGVFASVETAHDFYEEAARPRLPEWILSQPHSSMSKNDYLIESWLPGSTAPRLAALANPQVMFDYWLSDWDSYTRPDFDTPIPQALRLYALHPEEGTWDPHGATDEQGTPKVGPAAESNDGDDLPRLAFAGRFAQNDRARVFFDRLVRRVEERMEIPIDLHSEPIGDGDRLVLLTLNARVDELFDDPDRTSEVEALRVDGNFDEMLKSAKDMRRGSAKFMNNRWLWYLLLHDEIRIEARPGSRVTTASLRLGEHDRPYLKDVDSSGGSAWSVTPSCEEEAGTLYYRRISTIWSSLSEEDGSKADAILDDFARDLEHCRREDPERADELNRIEAHLFYIAARLAERAGSREVRGEYDEVACELGEERSCRANERSDRDRRVTDVPALPWDMPRPPYAECHARGAVSIDDEGVSLDGDTVLEIDLAEADDEKVRRAAEKLAERLRRRDMTAPGEMLRRYPTLASLYRSEVAIVAHPSTSARGVIRLWEALADIETLDALRPRAVFRVGEDEPTCATFHVRARGDGGGSKSNPSVNEGVDERELADYFVDELEASSDDYRDRHRRNRLVYKMSRLDIGITEDGFDVEIDGVDLNPVKNCPRDEPSICRFPEQATTPTTDSGEEDDGASVDGYDFDLANELLFSITKTAGNHRRKVDDLTVTLVVDEGVSWNLFVHTLEMTRQVRKDLDAKLEYPKFSEDFPLQVTTR